MGTDIAQQVRDYLKGGVVLQQAVNFYSLAGDLYDKVRPGNDGERLGLVLGQACPGLARNIELGVYGDLRELDLKPILAASVTGVLRPHMAEGVSPSSTPWRSCAVAGSPSWSQRVWPSPSRTWWRLGLKTSEGDCAWRASSGAMHMRLVDVDGVEVDTIPQGNILMIPERGHPGRPSAGWRSSGTRASSIAGRCWASAASRAAGRHADGGGQRAALGGHRGAGQAPRHPGGALPSIGLAGFRVPNGEILRCT